MTYQFSVCSGLLGEQKTRFIPYQPYRSLEEKFELASRVKGLDGLELGYPGDFEDVRKLKGLLSRYELRVSSVNLKVRGPDFMEKGSFTSPEKKALDSAIAWGKEAMDAVVEFDCDVITTCPLNDGFDYPFEMDYTHAWEKMIDGIRQVAEHRDDVKFAIEYKLSDPRTRSLISNVGEALFLARRTGRKNVGITLDFGHALIARENPSQAASMAAMEDKLFLVHMNDNDRVSDFDLVSGTVHFWETLEFFYYLPKLDYRGWIVTDVFPKSIDPARVFSITIEMQKRYIERAKTIDSLDIEEQVLDRDLMGVFEKLQTVVSAD